MRGSGQRGRAARAPLRLEVWEGCLEEALEVEPTLNVIQIWA